MTKRLTPNEAAAVLAMSPATLANWRTSGYGPPWARFGGAVRYDAGKLERWMSARWRRNREYWRLRRQIRTRVYEVLFHVRGQAALVGEWPTFFRILALEGLARLQVVRWAAVGIWHLGMPAARQRAVLVRLRGILTDLRTDGGAR